MVDFEILFNYKIYLCKVLYILNKKKLKDLV